jgi:hypothetical protein
VSDTSEGVVRMTTEVSGASVPPHLEYTESTCETSTFWEDTMDAKLAADAETLYQTATRLQRVGLVVDRRALSPAQRRAAFALQCLTARCPERDDPQRALIGFAYPNAR